MGKSSIGRGIVVGLVGLWLVLSLAACSKDEEDSIRLTTVAEWGTGPYYSLGLVDGYVLAAAWNNGLDIIDVHDPSAPHKVTNLHSMDYVRQVLIQGTRAFIVGATWNNADAQSVPQLQIIDVATPTSPTILGTLDLTSQTVYDMAINDTILVLLQTNHQYQDSLLLVDVSDPRNPRPLLDYQLSIIGWGLDFVGNLACVSGYLEADYSNRFQVIDLGNLAHPNPTLSGEMILGSEDEDFPGDLVIRDSLVYLIGIYDIIVIDITDSAAPREVNRVSAGVAKDLTVDDNLLLVPCGAAGAARSLWDTGGVNLFSLSDPRNPVELVFSYLPSQAWEIVSSEGFAFVADDTAGLIALDISTPAALVLAGSYDQSGEVSDVAMTEFGVAIADGENLRLFDADSDDSFTQRGNYHSHWIEQVEVTGTYAVTLGSFYSSLYMDIFDISNPAQPLKISSFYYHSATDLELSSDGRLAFLADSQSGLKIVDISDVSNPVEVSVIKPFPVSGLGVSGTVVYLAGNKGLAIVDAGDPTHPVLLSTLDPPGYALDVCPWNGYALLAARESGLQVIDVHDLTAPRLVGECATPRAVDVRTMGNYALVADSFTGILLIDLADPTKPVIVGTADQIYDPLRLTVHDRFIYVAGGWSGKLIKLRLDP
jgi:hypothetical protein